MRHAKVRSHREPFGFRAEELGQRSGGVFVEADEYESAPRLHRDAIQRVVRGVEIVALDSPGCRDRA